MTVHLPVSDSLNSLDREQLLKFAQYLLCEHQNEPVVETAQNLLDKLLSRQQKEQQDDINKIAGAPDPTAGPGKAVRHWNLSLVTVCGTCTTHMYTCILIIHDCMLWLLLTLVKIIDQGVHMVFENVTF